MVKLEVVFTASNVFKYGAFSGPNTGKYGPEKTPYLDTFHAVFIALIVLIKLSAYYLVLTPSYFSTYIA